MLDLDFFTDLFVLKLSGAADCRKDGGIRCDLEEPNIKCVIYFTNDSLKYAVVVRYRYNKFFSKAYYENGLLHKENGAAVLFYDGIKYYWIKGKNIRTIKQFKREVENDKG